MTRGWPDWMFAAFAIGGWELFDFVGRYWRVPHSHWVGGVVVAVCAMVLAVRFVLRWRHRLQNPDTPDPDEWKNY